MDFLSTCHSRPTRRLAAALLALAGGLCLLGGAALRGQTAIDWKNNGTSSIDSAGNWVGGAVPTASQVAQFSSGNFTPDELQPQSSSVSFAGIRLAAGAGALTFTGPGGGSAKTISLGSAGVANFSTQALTFDITSKVNITLVANAAFTANGPILIRDDSNRGSTTGFNIGAFTLTLNGTNDTSEIEKGFVGTGGSVVKSGSGTWTISGANSYTGATTLAGGVLSVSSLADGGTASNIGKSTNVAANLVFDGGTLRYTGAPVSTDRLFTLTANGGTLDASGSGALTLAATGSVVFSGANTSPTLVLTGNNSGGNTLAAAIGNNGLGVTSLTKNGPGAWVLAGNNTLAGTVTVGAGSLTVNSGASLGGSAAALVVNAGALNLNQSAQTVASLSGSGGEVFLGSGHVLTVNQAANTTFGSRLQGKGSLVKTGAGRLTLSGANSFAGSTTISGGTLAVSSDDNLGSVPSAATAGHLTLNGGALAATAGFTLNANRGLALGSAGGELRAESGTLSYGGIIAGAGALRKGGAGTLVLTGSNTFAGGTTVAGGLLQISANAALGTGSLTLDGGGIRFGAVFNDLRTFTVGSNGGTLDTNGFDVTVPSAISGSGALTKSGAGTLTLTGANSLPGAITVSGGRVVLSGSAVSSSATTPVNIAGGVIEFSGAAQSIATLQLTGGNVTGSANLSLAGAGSLWSGGSMAGSGSLTVESAASLTIAGATVDHDFTGREVVNNGTVNWTGGNLRAGSGSVLTNAGTFNDQNADPVAITVVPGSDGSFTFTNNGSYAKSGTGTTTFAIPVTNNSVFSVAAGKVQFASSFTQSDGTFNVGSAGVVQFDNGLTLTAGRLSGTGQVVGNVSSGGSIAPGNSPGTLTVSGDLNLLTTSVLLIELAGTVQGTDYDYLNVSGVAVINGSLDLRLLSTFPTSVAPSTTFTILTASSVTGSFTNVVSGGRLVTGDGYGSFQVNFTSGAIQLTQFQPVPEPSTYALLALGGSALAWCGLRRRRARTAASNQPDGYAVSPPPAESRRAPRR